MNETASATLVIQIFEFIRRSSLPSSPLSLFFSSSSSTLSHFSCAFLPPSILLVLSSLFLPPFCYPLFSNSSWLPTGQHTGEPLSLLAATVVLLVSAFTCAFLSFFLTVVVPLPLILFLPLPLARSSRFGNNKYALLRAASNARVTTWSRNFLLESDR